MEYHEYANIYRMLPERELNALADNIKSKGQLLPITSYEGKILDGRNRYRACQIAGIEPRIEEYTGDDPLGLISSLNDHRRHDIENERALVGARMANLKRGQMGNGRVDGSMEPSTSIVTIDRAAELSGSTRASIKRAKIIVESAIPELVDMVETGELSIRAGSELAKLPEDEQRKAIAGGAKGVQKATKKASAQSPSKPRRKRSIVTEADIEKENQRILGNLKTNWTIAPKPIREKFLAWVESTKNTTNA